MSAATERRAVAVCAELPSPAKLNVRHLQLQTRTSSALARSGVKTIADLVAFVRAPEFRDFDYRDEITSALAGLSECTSANEVDWRAYWRRMDGEFHYLCAALPELRRLSAAARSIPVNKAVFANAGSPFARAGYVTLGLLCDGLLEGIERPSGFGGKRVDDLFGQIIRIADNINDKGDVDLPEFRQIVEPGRYGDAFMETATQLPVGVLHPGAKTPHLRGNGVFTVADLVNHPDISRISGLGRSTAMMLHNRAAALHDNWSPETGVNWEGYCKSQNLTMIPGEEAAGDGESFLQRLPSVIAEIGDCLADETSREILSLRLSRPPRGRRTLDQIARSSASGITRERVRQKEKKLLRQLAEALVWDNYGSLEFHFRQSFSDHWKSAARRFRDAEEVGFDEFVSGLCEVWRTDAQSVANQLPLILAIVTGEPKLPADFLSAARLGAVYYSELPEATARLKIRKLRLGKYAARLEEDGMETIADVVAALRNDGAGFLAPRALDELLRQLRLLELCLDGSGAIDWEQYREQMALTSLPAAAPGDPREFLDGVVDAVRSLLETSSITARSTDIFSLRTCRFREERPTLEKTAAILQTHGPTIKREETAFLQYLNDLVVNGDYSHAPVWLEADWLRYWREAAAVYGETPGDIEKFENTLCGRWSVGKDAFRPARPTLWAVLSGYPSGRPPPKRRSRSADRGRDRQPPADIGRIRLRGFRRIH